MRWDIYYRGSLSSCNYACGYCPFAKTANTRAELATDRRQVQRFVDWVAGHGKATMSILFTPWGEALGHRYYRRALVDLSLLPQVVRVSMQTNLSAPLNDLNGACRESLTLWATYHPGEVARSRFLARCRQFADMGFRCSVGMVGMREHLDEIEAMRAELPDSIYLWVNAYKRVDGYYQEQELHRIRAVDPHFDTNALRHTSFGKSCRAGLTHFTVDGEGDVRRCHFVGEVLGNLYSDNFDTSLTPRLCPLPTCGCYIGYIHLPELELAALYGDDLLGRIPAGYP
jgi:MoaA/NifB/PqqE/SkfB family radical SAM enzyme